MEDISEFDAGDLVMMNSDAYKVVRRVDNKMNVKPLNTESLAAVTVSQRGDQVRGSTRGLVFDVDSLEFPA